MGRIIVSEFMTLDGVMEDPGGAEGFEHGGWAFQFDRGPKGDQFKSDELMASEGLLLGRITYKGFAKAWPTMTDESGFADKMNAMPKYVVSRTLTDAEATWNNTVVVRGPFPAAIADLKEHTDGDLLVAGSATLVQGLIHAGLVDEYRLMVYPVILGAGRRLFSGSTGRVPLALTTSDTAGDGILMLTYSPAADAS